MWSWKLVLMLLVVCVLGALVVVVGAQQDFYEVLEISRDDCDSRTIRSAYRRLARQWHPDKNANPDAEARFLAVTQAYTVLSDDQQRALYDAMGHEAWQARSSGIAGGGSGAADVTITFTFDGTTTDGGNGFNMEAAQQLFASMFAPSAGGTVDDDGPQQASLGQRLAQAVRNAAAAQGSASHTQAPSKPVMGESGATLSQLDDAITSATEPVVVFFWTAACEFGLRSDEATSAAAEAQDDTTTYVAGSARDPALAAHCQELYATWSTVHPVLEDVVPALLFNCTAQDEVDQQPHASVCDLALEEVNEASILWLPALLGNETHRSWDSASVYDQDAGGAVLLWQWIATRLPNLYWVGDVATFATSDARARQETALAGRKERLHVIMFARVLAVQKLFARVASFFGPERLVLLYVPIGRKGNHDIVEAYGLQSSDGDKLVVMKRAWSQVEAHEPRLNGHVHKDQGDWSWAKVSSFLERVLAKHEKQAL